MAADRDIQALLENLRNKVACAADVTGIRPLTAGHSNETYVLEGLNAILRLPPSTPPVLQGHGVITQGQVYRELGSLGDALPTPRILHIEGDPSLLGDPFFIMEKVAGVAVTDYVLPAWFTEATPEQRESVSRQWVAAIGSIATLQPLAAFGRPVTPEEDALKWRDWAANAECPALVDLYDRLLSRPAPRSGPASPVHGDPKIANLMWSEFRLSSVLDWELGHNGEPLTDLGYVLYFFRPEIYFGVPLPSLSGVIDREAAVEAWEIASGRSAEGREWYEAAAVGKIAAIVARGYQMILAGESHDPKMARWKEMLDSNIDLMDTVLG